MGISKQIYSFLFILIIATLMVPIVFNISYTMNHAEPPQLREVYSTKDNNNHWYAGSLARNYVYYAAKELSFQLTVPSGKPPDQHYYVLLSCFDNNDSYNQIGIENYYGSMWVIVFSWTTVHGSYWDAQIKYHVNRFSCISGKTYLFKMIADGKGNIKYIAYYKSGNSWVKQWEETYSTGGTYFVVDDIYWFKWAFKGAYDFTDYEEFWSGTPNTPTYDFDFVNTRIVYYDYNNNLHTLYFNYWQEYYVDTPSSVTVHFSTNHVYIDNPNPSGD